MAKRPNAYAALLRSVNLGNTNKLPMKELAAMFTAAGCSEVTTYIQSGNVVFRASSPLARRIPDTISAAIEERFGFSTPVITRTAEEIAAIARDNPFLAAGEDPRSLHVAFLAGAPGEERIATLDLARFAPDRIAVRGREIYLHLPNGVGKSKLTNRYLDTKLATTSTIRNWNTVLALHELATAG